MKRLLPALAVASVATLAAAAPASAEIFFSDTYLSVRNLWQDRQPGTSGNVNETAGNIQYANAWTYGYNFASVDFEDFSKKDGANNVAGKKATSNSNEVYSVFRTGLSLNAITGSKKFAFGPFQDISLEVGGDICTQDDQFASYKRMVVVGPRFYFAVPKGFWSVALHLSHEWNTNGFAANNSTNFNIAPELETAWLYPMSVGNTTVKFTGFLNIIGPKGRGGSDPADAKTGTEILAHPKLMVDIGPLIGAKPGQFDAGVGYEYWYNKFGNLPKYTYNNGTQQNAWFIEAGYHF